MSRRSRWKAVAEERMLAAIFDPESQTDKERLAAITNVVDDPLMSRSGVHDYEMVQLVRRILGLPDAVRRADKP